VYALRIAKGGYMLQIPPTPEWIAKNKNRYVQGRNARGDENGTLQARYAYRLAVRTDDWEWLCLRITRLHNTFLMRTGYGGTSWDDVASGDEPNENAERYYSALVRVFDSRQMARLVWLCDALNDGEDVARLRANLAENQRNDDDLFTVAEKTLDNASKKL
jgi:hypothetical protein